MSDDLLNPAIILVSKASGITTARQSDIQRRTKTAYNGEAKRPTTAEKSTDLAKPAHSWTANTDHTPQPHVSDMGSVGEVPSTLHAV